MGSKKTRTAGGAMGPEPGTAREDPAAFRPARAAEAERLFGSGEEPRRRKRRERTEREALAQRLSRVEGQVRGVRKMLEDDAYCTDLLIQVSAIQSALNAFSRELLANHIRTCVVTDIQSGRLEVVDDLLATIQKMM